MPAIHLQGYVGHTHDRTETQFAAKKHPNPVGLSPHLIVAEQTPWLRTNHKDVELESDSTQ